MRTRSCRLTGSAVGGGALRSGPFAQSRLDRGFEDLGASAAPVLPREILIPAAPGAVLHVERGLRLRQRQIADGHDVRADVAGLGVPAAIAECVELLGIAELEPRLPVHPGAQAALEGAVLQRRERPERQPVRRARHIRLVANDEHDGLVVGHGDDGRVEADLDPGRAELGSGISVAFHVRRQLPELMVRHGCPPTGFGTPCSGGLSFERALFERTTPACCFSLSQRAILTNVQSNRESGREMPAGPRRLARVRARPGPAAMSAAKPFGWPKVNRCFLDR